MEYSEPGVQVPLGSLGVLTTKTALDGSPFTVTLSANQSADIQIEGLGENGIKELAVSPRPYTLVIENSGRGSSNGNIIITVKIA